MNSNSFWAFPSAALRVAVRQARCSLGPNGPALRAAFRVAKAKKNCFLMKAVSFYS